MNTLLFIPSILEHKYELVFVKFGILMSLWLFILIACFIDLNTGIKASRAVGNFKTNSYGLRRTGNKIKEYWTLMFLALFIDFSLSSLAIMKDQFPWLGIFQVPFISTGLFLGIMVTEIISVKENLEKAKGADIIPQKTVDLIINITKKLGEGGEDKLKAIAEILENPTKTEQNHG